jgi:hypothetical protein
MLRSATGDQAWVIFVARTKYQALALLDQQARCLRLANATNHCCIIKPVSTKHR